MRFLAINASSTPRPHAVVIGGGVGGIATACRLAKDNRFSVTLLEKNNSIGGRMQSEYIETTENNIYRFDTGPSLLLFPNKYQETFDALDYPMPTILPISPAYRVFFASSPSFTVDLTNDADAMCSQLENLEQGAGEAYKRFLKMARNHLDLGVPYFIDRDFTELKDATKLLDLLPSMTSINPWHLLGPHDTVMRGFFKDARLRAAFTFQDLYVGLKPSQAPAVFSLLAGTELTDGVYYPQGGFGAIRDALLKAAEQCGVTIKTNTEVVGIKTTGLDTKNVQAVHTRDGQSIQADIIVCNRDLPAAYDLLLHSADPEIEEYAQQRSKSLSSLKYSSGVIAFNWCVNNTENNINSDRLCHHNVFLSEEYSKAWKPAKTPLEFVKYPNFYMHVPSKTDPTAAPPKCLSIMVLLPVANMQHLLPSNSQYTTNNISSSSSNSNSDTPTSSDYAGNNNTNNNIYTDLINEGKERVLRTLRDAGIGDIGPYIEKELILSPPEWKSRYGLQHGAAFGLAHGLDQLSIFRPGNKDPLIEGLYFVGASTRPGNGVPLCFISAKLTANRILKDYCPDDT